MDNQFLIWRQEGHKYGCNSGEVIAMVLVTAITNLSILPVLVLAMKKGMTLQFYMGTFTMITSFMYHLAESLGADKLFMEESKWHQLDNIGAILCFTSLLVHMANLNDYELEQKLNYSSIFVVTILQIADPWNLWYTLLPIIGYGAAAFLWSWKLGHPTFSNIEMTRKGIASIVLGAFFFVMSQDEHDDYLRIYHGLWHCFVGLSTMYTWQTNEHPDDHMYTRDILSKFPKKRRLIYDQGKHI